MLKRMSFFAYGSFSYLVFLGTFLYAIGFVGNFGVPTALDHAAIADRTKWRMRPLLGVDVDRICVRHQQERPFRAVTLESRDQVRTMGLEREDLNGNSFRLENLFQVIDHRLLATRRICRIHLQNRLEVAHRLFVDFSPNRAASPTALRSTSTSSL